MNTYLSSAQEVLKNEFAEFARKEVEPIALALTRREHALEQLLQKLGQRGYLGMTVPSEYGGKATSLLDVIMMVEAISHYEPGLSLTLANHYAVVETIKRYGSDTQKSRYLPLLAQGELIATLAFSEKGAGTDFEAVTSTVENGSFSGEKVLVINADSAGLMLVLSKAGSDLRLDLLDVTRGDSLKLVKEHNMLGLRSNHVHDVQFKAHKLPSENLIKTAIPAKDVALYAMDVAKLIVAAGALGLLEGALDISVTHAREREQFGTNIGQFQGVQWKLADLAVDTTASRLQTYRAAWSHDEKFEDFTRHSSMSKWFVARAAKLHSGEALQILASQGLEVDSPLERFYRDAKAMEIVQGTTEFQKMLLIKELDI